MGQPVAPTMITFDPNSLGSNPWNSTTSQDSATSGNMLQGANANLADLNSQLTDMGGQPVGGNSAGSSNGGASYPAMQNAYGLGSTPSGAGMGSGSGGSSPINISLPDTSTRGANPWSFQGESNARGGGPPPTTPQSTQGT